MHDRLLCPNNLYFLHQVAAFTVSDKSINTASHARKDTRFYFILQYACLNTALLFLFYFAICILNTELDLIFI